MLQHPDIIQNKYFRLYIRIIESNINNNEYTENHHILPKSMGGEDLPYNMARISARRHFLLHYLLTKFTTNESLHKCRKAFNMMNVTSKSHNGYRYFNSRLYNSNRKHMSETMSLAQSGKNNSQYGKIWMYNLLSDIAKPFSIHNINEALEQNWIISRTKNYKYINPNKRTIKRIISYKDFKFMGAQLRIYSPLGYVISIRENYLYEYVIDGWINIKSESYTTRKRTYLTNGKDNIIIPIEYVNYLTQYGKWIIESPHHVKTVN